jgi:hypothetical protein
MKSKAEAGKTNKKAKMKKIGAGTMPKKPSNPIAHIREMKKKIGQ